MKYGFIKVASAVPAVRVADIMYNVQEIERLIAMAEEEHAEVVCFPELCITGYSCQDLFKETLLLNKAEEGLLMLLEFTRKMDVISIVGMPILAGLNRAGHNKRPDQLKSILALPHRKF